LQPLEGRRLWFAGIGGAGLSAYAVLARAWGAQVSGWDRVETPYLAYVREAGIPVTVTDEPTAAPEGAEAVVSTAFAGRVVGKGRAEFLAELVSLQDSLVVAGTHGKSTTAAMIAFCLDRLGRDPSFLIGAEVPQLGGNARAGTGVLLVEGDESDRTVERLRPRIAVLTNIELDHHSTFRSTAELESLFEQWLAEVPEVVHGDRLEPAAVELLVPGEHNRRNAAAALAALELLGVDRGDAASVLAEFEGVRGRFELVGARDGISVYDDYAHHPREIAVTLAAARELAGEGRLLVAFQPHLYSRTRHLARELAASLASADAVCVTDVYPAREEPVEGVSGKLVVDALAELRPGSTPGWTPTLGDAAAFLSGRIRESDLVLTIGAGDIGRVASLVLEKLQ
jgi:UDP-N-acetylmuramate--alanine ligase